MLHPLPLYVPLPTNGIRISHPNVTSFQASDDKDNVTLYYESLEKLSVNKGDAEWWKGALKDNKNEIYRLGRLEKALKSGKRPRKFSFP